MGIEVALLTMSAIATAGEAGAQITAAGERKNALDVQAKEMQIQTQQKSLQNLDIMERTIAAQTAHMTTTGTAMNSPSFNAIQRNTLNIGAKKEANNELEGNLEQQNVDIEKQNVNETLWSQLFGDIGQTASSAFSIASKAPKKGAA